MNEIQNKFVNVSIDSSLNKKEGKIAANMKF